MKMNKIDLTSIVAVGHEDGYLALLIDRGDEMEYIEVPAPADAYFGLQGVAELADEENAYLYSDEVPFELPHSAEAIPLLPGCEDEEEEIVLFAEDEGEEENEQEDEDEDEDVLFEWDEEE